MLLISLDLVSGKLTRLRFSVVSRSLVLVNGNESISSASSLTLAQTRLLFRIRFLITPKRYNGVHCLCSNVLMRYAFVILGQALPNKAAVRYFHGFMSVGFCFAVCRFVANLITRGPHLIGQLLPTDATPALIPFPLSSSLSVGLFVYLSVGLSVGLSLWPSKMVRFPPVRAGSRVDVQLPPGVLGRDQEVERQTSQPPHPYHRDRAQALRRLPSGGWVATSRCSRATVRRRIVPRAPVQCNAAQCSAVCRALTVCFSCFQLT